MSKTKYKKTIKLKEEKVKYYQYTTGDYIVGENIETGEFEIISVEQAAKSELVEIITEIRTLDDEFIEEKEETVSLYSLLKNYDLIPCVKKSPSPIKPAGFYQEKINHRKSNFFNTFKKQRLVQSALEDNKYSKYKDKDDMYIFSTLLKKECKPLYYLLKNLHYSEYETNKAAIINILIIIRTKLFTDNHIPNLIIYAALDEYLKGSGAGKGVWMEFLTNLFGDDLVGIETNKSVVSDFNYHLSNKRVVFFDEANVLKLDYDRIKENVRSPRISIRKHGVGYYPEDNQKSHFMFTNHDTIPFLQEDDRTTVLIYPYGETESLMKNVVNKYYKSDFDLYKKELYECEENFVHILFLLKSRYKSPTELPTNAKKIYFKIKQEVKVEKIDGFYSLILDNEMNKYVVGKIKEYEPNFDKNKIKLLENKIINYKLFSEVFNVLSKNNLLNKKTTLNISWEKLKEGLTMGLFMIKVDTKETTKHKRYKDNVIILKRLTKLNKNKYKALLIDIYREEKIDKKTPEKSENKELDLILDDNSFLDPNTTEEKMILFKKMDEYAKEQRKLGLM